ncbi:MAG: GNAT family N-acetyltransferase [Ilumatobacter sp.]
MTAPAVTVEQIDWGDFGDDMRRNMLRLNLESRRQCPFFTPEYIDASIAHSEEFDGDAIDAFVLVVKAANAEVIGMLPLRRTWNRAAVPFRQIEFLAGSEVDLPDVIAAQVHETTVAEAVMSYVPKLLRSASAVHLPKLSAHSAMFPARESASTWWTQRQEGPGMPVSHIPIVHHSVDEYFGALSKRMRSNVSRLGRRLDAAGEVEVLSGSASAALLELFEAYLLLEDRSWKRSTEAAIRRHDQRVQMFRELFTTADAVTHHVELVMLDGQPIAGLISMSLGSSSFLMETCYDERFSEFSPSNLLILLAIDRAIRAGKTEVSLHGHFDYYKHRWLAEMVDTCDVRVVRPGSVPQVRTSLGGLARRLAGRGDRSVEVPSGSRQNGAELPDQWPQESLQRLAVNDAIVRCSAPIVDEALPFDMRAS